MDIFEDADFVPHLWKTQKHQLLQNRKRESKIYYRKVITDLYCIKQPLQMS